MIIQIEEGDRGPTTKSEDLWDGQLCISDRLVIWDAHNNEPRPISDETFGDRHRAEAYLTSEGKGPLIETVADILMDRTDDWTLDEIKELTLTEVITSTLYEGPRAFASEVYSRIDERTNKLPDSHFASSVTTP